MTTKMIKYPKWLTNVHARNYWKDHAAGLTEKGILTADNADLFALMCEVWGELRTVDKSDSKGRVYYIALLKQLQSLSKRFAAGEKTPSFMDLISDCEMEDDAEEA